MSRNCRSLAARVFPAHQVTTLLAQKKLIFCLNFGARRPQSIAV
jgi:hypothetical protein